MKVLAAQAILRGGSLFAADLALVEEIVAKCNGDIITRGDLDRSRKQLIEALRHEGLTGPAMEQTINVNSEVDKRLAEIKKAAGTADPEKFQDWVKEQAGMPFEDFKSDMKNDMLRQRVIRQEVGERVSIKHDEVEKYYNEHKSEFVREERLFLREIFISTEGKDAAATAAAEKKAKDLVARARKGERFPEMARDNSEAVTAKGMGELPPFKKGDMPANIEEQVCSQPKGYVTDPIRNPNGFLILRVEEHQKAGQAELSEVENEITEKLYGPRMQPKIREYLTELRKSAFLEIKADYVDSGAAAGKDTAWM